jgi:hypothetical protein
VPLAQGARSLGRLPDHRPGRGPHRHRRQHRPLRRQGARTTKRPSSRPTSRPSRRSPTSSASATSAASSSRLHRHGARQLPREKVLPALARGPPPEGQGEDLGQPHQRPRPRRDDPQAHARVARPHCSTSPASTATARATSARKTTICLRDPAADPPREGHLPGLQDRQVNAHPAICDIMQRDERTATSKRPSAASHGASSCSLGRSIIWSSSTSRADRPWLCPERTTRWPRPTTSEATLASDDSRSTRSSSPSTPSSRSTSPTSRAPASSLNPSAAVRSARGQPPLHRHHG